MHVFSFEYVVPRVLVSLCTKFDKNPRRKTCFVDVLLSGSILTGHIRSQSQTYPVLQDCSTSFNVNSSWLLHRAFISCAYHSYHTLTLVPFLKAMAGEGHERCSKQRQGTGGSSSSQGPFAHPKKPAKRPRPSSLREESSPEDYPPHGGTPDFPKEVECLKIRALDYHINREEVDYNKEDPRNIITLWDKSCYNHSKERGIDEIFLTFFHQDWYHSVLYKKTS
jgi:hypothetical protein